MTKTVSNISISDVNNQVINNYNKTKIRWRISICTFFIVVLLISILRLPYTGAYIDAVLFEYIFGVAKYFVYAFLLTLLITKLINKKLKIYFKKKRWLFEILLLLFILIMASAVSWLCGNHKDVNQNFIDPLVKYQEQYKTYLTTTGFTSWASYYINPYLTGGIIGEFAVAVSFTSQYITLFLFEFIVLIVSFMVLTTSDSLKIFKKIRKGIVKLLGGEFNDIKTISEELASKSSDKKPQQLDINSIKMEAIGEKQQTPLLSFLTDTGINFDIKNKDKFSKYQKQFERFLEQKQIKVSFNKSCLMPLYTQLIYTVPDENTIYKIFHYKQDILNIFRTDKVNFYLKGNNLVIESLNPNPSKVSIKNILCNKLDSTINEATVGVSFDSTNIFYDFSKDPSTLIIGKPGSGAIMEVSSLIMSRVYKNTPNQLKVLLCSVSEEKVFETFSNLTHLYTAPSISQEDTATNLVNILDVIEQRKKMFADNKCKDINEYNAKLKQDSIPKILVAIFNVEKYLNASPNNSATLLKLLSKDAIDAGIEMILYAETIDEYLWTSYLQDNVKSYFIFKVDQEDISKMILKSSKALQLFGNGDGYMLLKSDHSKTRIQSCYINKNEILETIKIINTFYECKQK